MSTNRDAIFAGIRDILIQHLGVPADRVVETASIIDDFGADSLDSVELIMAIEDRFLVDIPDQQAERMIIVKDAVDYLERALCVKSEMPAAEEGPVGEAAAPSPRVKTNRTSTINPNKRMTAAQKRKLQDEGTVFCCHIDHWDGQLPTDCVIDEGHDGCAYAVYANGSVRKSRETCEHWKPLNCLPQRFRLWQAIDAYVHACGGVPAASWKAAANLSHVQEIDRIVTAIANHEDDRPQRFRHFATNAFDKLLEIYPQALNASNRWPIINLVFTAYIDTGDQSDDYKRIYDAIEQEAKRLLGLLPKD